MRLFVVLAALGALSQTAIAQTPDCKSIADAAQRLVCYDKAAPPLTSAEKAAAARRAAPVTVRTPGSKADTEKYVDTISAEDALMNARLRNICRGC